ncbi:MAG: hypothetical protein HY608_02070 [Planctomycetes bacterium]|nr:hypothetical protein [Planctomycetota bacterium]
MTRTRLKTVRLTPAEDRRIAAYLKENPLFDGFGALARKATLEFVASRPSIPLRPETGKPPTPPATAPDALPLSDTRRPAFLWDYDLTEKQVRETLEHGGAGREWLLARILDRAPLPEVLRYATLEEIRDALPDLKLPPGKKEHWEYALRRWLGDG